MPRHPSPRHLAPRRVVTVVALALVSSGLTACGGGSTPEPTPSPSAVPLRALEVCATTVVVPSDAVSTTPDATSPPTVSLQVGGALTFSVPAGARVGLLDAADPDVDATVCTAGGTSTAATVVALAEGYLRLGVQVGIQPVAQLLVKVTPA